MASIRGVIFRERHLPHIRSFPRTREPLVALRAAGLKLAVATSAEKEELEPLLERAGASDLIEYKASSDDAESSKPDPDIVQAALRRLGLPRSDVVMIGDTPYDVEAATRAGIPIIAFRSGGWDDESLKGVREIYDGPRGPAGAPTGVDDRRDFPGEVVSWGTDSRQLVELSSLL